METEYNSIRVVKWWRVLLHRSSSRVESIRRPFLGACTGLKVSCSRNNEFKQNLNVLPDSGLNIQNIQNIQPFPSHSRPVFLTLGDHGGKDSVLIGWFAAFRRTFCNVWGDARPRCRRRRRTSAPRCDRHCNGCLGNGQGQRSTLMPPVSAITSARSVSSCPMSPTTVVGC